MRIVNALVIAAAIALPVSLYYAYNWGAEWEERAHVTKCVEFDMVEYPSYLQCIYTDSCTLTVRDMEYMNHMREECKE